MNTHDFAQWLHGFTELTGGAMPTEAQWSMIVEHLDLCFNKVTRPLPGDARPPVKFCAPRPRMLTEKEAGMQLGKILREKVEAELEQAEKVKVEAEEKAKAEKAAKEAQAKKDADAAENAKNQRAFAERLHEALKRSQEAEQKRKADGGIGITPFFPPAPQPFWLDRSWPGDGILTC